ncbi:MAG: WecB/TagA/CpsF family glycosyltransferase [Woeseiaceae bacterium]
MIGVVNAAKIVNMSKSKELRDDVLSSDLILADGMSVVVASRVLGVPLPERITGIDLMMSILQRGSESAYRCYCLGATDEVSALVADKIARLFPGVELVGRRDGFFKESEEAALAASIASLDVDVLFVAITSPKKERFMAKWGHTLNATVVHGVGGSFDVLAGKVQRAPEAWQRSGFEWFYRVKQEPRRLWKRYLVTNIGFAGMLFVAWCRKAVRPGRT